jgi:DNA-binding response OmpR family regulator
MTFVFLITREPRLRSAATEYLRERGYDIASAESYDDAMETLPSVSPDALVVDVQGVPRDQAGSTFAAFNHWLASRFRDSAPQVVYLLHKGSRRPVFRITGTVIKKPFPLEALGEALREKLGHPRREGHPAGLDLDLSTNTLRASGNTAHLTNIEASLLAYLMEHEGKILPPRDLLVDVWEYHDSAGASTLVRAHISNLRRKLRELVGTDGQIQTIRGKGYRFVA